MCCLALIMLGLGPRFAVAAWWIFGDRVELAFDGWVLPLLGLLFLPWTTLAYLVVWSPIVGVDGWEWIIVALGFVLDIASYSSRAARSRYQSSRAY
jgi:hypothetical protein